MQDLEHQEQCKVITWCKLNESMHPLLKLIYATPNARKCTPRQGKWLNDEGRRKGVPDLCLPVPIGNFMYKENYNNLYIEMKYGKNILSKEQAEFLLKLEDAGNKVVVCYSFEEAVKEICEYLDIPYNL